MERKPRKASNPNVGLSVSSKLIENRKTDFDQEFDEPGEYLRKINRYSSEGGGWTSFEHNGKKIFLTSLNYAVNEEFTKHNQIGERIDLTKISETPDPKRIEEFVATIEHPNKLDNGGKNLLIHCNEGKNRTPAAAVIYLLKDGVPLEEAAETVETAMRQRFGNFSLETHNRFYPAIKQAAAEQVFKPSDQEEDIEDIDKAEKTEETEDIDKGLAEINVKEKIGEEEQQENQKKKYQPKKADVLAKEHATHFQQHTPKQLLSEGRSTNTAQATDYGQLKQESQEKRETQLLEREKERITEKTEHTLEQQTEKSKVNDLSTSFRQDNK